MTIIARDDRATWRKPLRPCRWPGPARSRSPRRVCGRNSDGSGHAISVGRFEESRRCRLDAAGERVEPAAPRNREPVGSLARGAQALDAESGGRQLRHARLIPSARAGGRGQSAPARSAATSSSGPQPGATGNGFALRGGDALCEFEDPKKYREAVQMARGSFGPAGAHRSIWVAPPRIFKMGEEWILQQVRASSRTLSHPQLRSLALLHRLPAQRGFLLNVANPLTADYFKNHFGLERLTASYDLNAAQLEALCAPRRPSGLK